MRTAGVIRQLRRYPVKSMRGESLPATTLTLQGIPADRRFAFVQNNSCNSFPWFTARELPELLCYSTHVENTDLKEFEVLVTTPDGETVPIHSEKLRQAFESRSGKNLYLLQNYRGSFDVAPISLISCQTVLQIAKESDTEDDPVRFRSNILLDLESDEPFEELKWVGRTLRVGDTARIAITQADKRCMIITLDPTNAAPSPAVLRTVTQLHNQCAGVYATVLTPGDVQVGDIVFLDD